MLLPLLTIVGTFYVDFCSKKKAMCNCDDTNYYYEQYEMSLANNYSGPRHVYLYFNFHSSEIITFPLSMSFFFCFPFNDELTCEMNKKETTKYFTDFYNQSNKLFPFNLSLISTLLIMLMRFLQSLA